MPLLNTTAHPGSSSLFATQVFSGGLLILHLRTKGRETRQRRWCVLAPPSMFTSTPSFPHLETSGKKKWHDEVMLPAFGKHSGQPVMRLMSNTLLFTDSDKPKYKKDGLSRGSQASKLFEVARRAACSNQSRMQIVVFTVWSLNSLAHLPRPSQKPTLTP